MTSHRFFHKEIKKQYVGRKGQKMDEIDFLFLIKLHQKFLTKKMNKLITNQVQTM